MSFRDPAGELQFKNLEDMHQYYEHRKELKKTTKRAYIVISTYYKHAECSYTFFYSDDDLRQYLTVLLSEYYDGEYEESVAALTPEEMKTLDIDKLCIHAAIHGNYRISNEVHWGIRAVIRVPGAPSTVVNEDKADRAIDELKTGGKRKRADSEEEQE